MFCEHVESPKSRHTLESAERKLGRGERIRTSDSCVPNAVLYQAELHPEPSAGLHEAPLGIAIARIKRVEQLQSPPIVAELCGIDHQE